MADLFKSYYGLRIRGFTIHWTRKKLPEQHNKSSKLDFQSFEKVIFGTVITVFMHSFHTN